MSKELKDSKTEPWYYVAKWMKGKYNQIHLIHVYWIARTARIWCEWNTIRDTVYSDLLDWDANKTKIWYIQTKQCNIYTYLDPPVKQWQKFIVHSFIIHTSIECPLSTFNITFIPFHSIPYKLAWIEFNQIEFVGCVVLRKSTPVTHWTF